MKHFLLIFAMLFVGMTTVMAQRTITGTVTDENGNSLPFANVFVEGTTVGTTTDIDGNYTLKVPEGGTTLVVAYTGYSDMKLALGDSNSLNFTMAEGVILDDIVVTALGIEKEERTLGYSVDQVDAEELVKARSTNIVNSLQGKVTGVQITNTSGNLGGSSKIIIRGATSLSGRNNPLWVIDGMPFNDNQYVSGSRISGNRDFGNGASVVNPDDIETISVLKGAAATALYGSRAAAGAIIVTTKRGKATETGKPRVEINSSYRWDDLFVVPEYQQEYTMGTLAKYDSSSVGFDWGPRFVGQNVDALPIVGGPGALRQVEDNGVKDFFKTGNSLINNISLSDGNEKMDYRMSMSALNQTGIVPGSSLDRYTVSLNSGMRHSDKLRSRFGIQFIKTDSEGTAAAGANDPNIIGLSSFSSNLDQTLFEPWIDDTGNQINQTEPTANNPFWIRHENRNDRDDSRLLANMSVTYTPIENLDIIGKIGYDFDQDNRFLSNRKGTAQRIEGDFTVDKINDIQLNSDIIARYGFDITPDISFSVLGGFNYNRRKLESETLGSTNLLVPELFDPGNTELNVAGRSFREQVLMGAYTSIDLGYKNWATLTLTGRNDWSSTLPIDNNSYFYPSASLAFVFTDAFQIPENNIISYGKLRASYAQVGNDTEPYQLNFNFFPISQATGQYGLNANFPFDGRLAFAKSNIIPPDDLRPERQNSYEVGAELDFFDYRLGLDISYFKSENKDQILALPIPESTGFASLRTNVGQVNTSGIEFTVDAVPVNFKNFKWNTSINYSAPKTKVIKLAEGVDRVLLSSAFNSVQVVAAEGGGIELLGIPFLRDSVTGRPLINPDDGTRLAGEAETLGSVLPDFNMGFVNSFDIFGVNLSFTVDWRSGGVMKSSTVEGLQTGGLVTETLQNREGTFIDRDGVIDNGDGTVRDNDIPLASAQTFWTSINNNSIAEAFVFDASFVKLREVAINYTLPQSLLGNTFLDRLTIGVEARNVALLYSKVPHIDPESNLFGSGRDGWGVERASVPTPRSIGINLKAAF